MCVLVQFKQGPKVEYHTSERHLICKKQCLRMEFTTYTCLILKFLLLGIPYRSSPVPGGHIGPRQTVPSSALGGPNSHTMFQQPPNGYQPQFSGFPSRQQACANVSTFFQKKIPNLTFFPTFNHFYALKQRSLGASMKDIRFWCRFSRI